MMMVVDGLERTIEADDYVATITLLLWITI
jgi:hypothetical protein